MIDIAKAITDDDVRASSEYYAALKPHSRQKVVESATAPKSFVGGGGMRYASPEGGTEPIGSRIIIIPDSAEGAQRRNPKSNFVAYVPPGSIARGQKLAAATDGSTIACGICHGPALKGLGDVPASPVAIRPTVPAALRHAAGPPQRRRHGAHDRGGREAFGRRHDRALRLSAPRSSLTTIRRFSEPTGAPMLTGR
jgi:cytochrome c553